MKKFFTAVFTASMVMSAFTFAQSVSTSTVVDFLFENGMTKFNTVVDFRANASITRGEAAKFIGEFAQAIEFDGSYNGSCTFSDIAGYDYTLIPHIDIVCEMGLIKGSGGRYMPNASLTEAEALTILMRSQTGFEDETGARWYEGYFMRGVQEGLVSSYEIDTVATTPITRGRLGLWIYQIMNPMGDDMLDDEDTLESLLSDIFSDEEEVPSSEDTTRTIGATMNVYDSESERRDGFVPYATSALQNALNTDTQVVLYFSADWCPTCQALTSSLEADQFAFPDDLLVLTIDFDEQTDLVTKYGVARQHTLVYLDSNGVEAKRTVATAYTLEDIEQERPTA